jgi:hypothetical protein
MSTKDELLGEIAAFLAETAMAPSTFGRHAVNDGKFVGRLRNGAGLTVATVDRVRDYMKAERERAAGEGQAPGVPPGADSSLVPGGKAASEAA